MAFSLPLSASVRQKGQTALICQLCENDSKLKWKCLDCELLMCQRCKEKVHPKFPSAEDHTIIDIKDISKHHADSGPKLDLTKLKCEVHPGKMCCMYCTTCQELVCQTCIAKTHNKHDFGEISDEYQTKVEKVKKRLREIKHGKENLTKKEQILKQIKSAEQSNYDKVKQEILDDETALVSEIKKHTIQLLKELDQKREEYSFRVENEEQNLKEKGGQSQKQMQDINHLLQPNNVRDVFSFTDSLFTHTNIPLVDTSFNGIPKLTYGDRSRIPLILGKLKDVPIQYNTELKVDKEFETELEVISSVLSCPNGSLWLSESDPGTIQNVKPNGDNLKVLSRLEIKVSDAALLPSGDLLLSVGSSILKLIPSGSTDIQDSVYTVSQLETTGVHVTCDNKVIVGAGGGESLFPADGPRQVIVMDQIGRHEKVFQYHEYDRHNKPLFTVPYHITSNKIRSIAVIDCLSASYKGRIVVLDQEGSVKNIYTGHPDVNNEDNPFTPVGITTTPSDNFVVADPGNHTLHILNSEGEIITFYNTKEMGILLPFSLSFSTCTSGQLYIGNHCGSEEEGKLFRIDNFFF